MPKPRKPKPAQYPTAPEEVSLPEAPVPSTPSGKKGSKKTRKRAPKRAKKAATAVPEPMKTEAVMPAKRTRPKQVKRSAPKKARLVRRNPAPQIEAAFYQLGALTEFEFEEEGVEKRFAFEKAPVLAADSSGKLRVVYDPKGVPGAKIPQKITELHETFNGFSPDRHTAGVFGKRVPGTKAMGVLKALTYFSKKCVDQESCSSPGHYRHAFEAPFPRVLVNPVGLVLIEGGSYEITRAGIIH